MKISNISVSIIDHMGSDLSVVNAARVSFHKESCWEPTDTQCRKLSDRDVKLINYLAKHNHKSPFNHCFLSFRVKAPLFVARQLVKHEYLPWNEVSRRYVDEEPEFYWPLYFRGKPENTKQGSSSKMIIVEDLYPINVIENCLFMYEQLLENGVCPEQARMILPQNMMTEWIWSGSLFAFIKMLKLRLDEHTQQETRDTVVQIAEHVKALYPVSYEALMNV